MKSDRDRSLARLRVPDESIRIIEAGLAAGTGGAGLRLMVICLTAATAAALAVALGAIGKALFEAAMGDSSGLQIAGFALAFAAPFAISLVFQISFLRRLRRS